MKNSFRYYLLFAVLFCSAFTFASPGKYTSDKVKALYIYNFTKYFDWPDEKKLTEFKIGVLGESLIYDTLLQMLPTKKFGTNKIPFKIIKLKDASEIKKIQILYISPEWNTQEDFFMENILKTANEQHTLVIADGAEKAMLNFIATDGKPKFEINKCLVDKSGIKMQTALLALCANVYEDCERLFTNTISTSFVAQKSKQGWNMFYSGIKNEIKNPTVFSVLKKIKVPFYHHKKNKNEPDSIREQIVHQKALYIFKLADEFLEWPNQNVLKSFEIVVLGDTLIYHSLLALSEIKKIHNLSVKITDIEKTEDEIINNAQILFTDQNDSRVASTLYKINSKPVLLITDNYLGNKFMFNFILVHDTLQFEINTKRIEQQGIKIMNNLTEIAIVYSDDKPSHQGISEDEKIKAGQDWEALLEKELQKERTTVSQQKEQLSAKEIEIKEQQKAVEQLNAENKIQQKNLEEKLKVLKGQEETIEQQKQDITAQETKVKSQIEKLNVQEKEIQDKQEKIKSQDVVLSEQIIEMKREQQINYLAGIIILFIGGFGFYIYRNSKKLAAKNRAIEFQKQEIEKQNISLEEKSAQLEKSYQNITILSQIGQKITSTLNLEKILNTVYENAATLMDATEFGLGVYMEKEQTIEMQPSYYQSKKVTETYSKVSMQDDNRLSVWCVKNKKEIFVNDMEQEYENYISSLDSYKDNTGGAFLLQSMICLPLLIEKKVCGILYVQSARKNAYTPIQLEMFRTLASYTAVALNNAEAYRQLDTANTQLAGKNKAIELQKKELEKQKLMLEEHQKEITDSIRYAKRLQEAILPPVSLINEYFAESFVLYKPKDIVAGDFYWMEVLPSLSGEGRGGEVVFIAAADCTGHGVPGAMVSVVCSNALNRAVKEFNLHDTGKILDKVTDLVLETFEKSGEEIKDGMDISILAFNKTTKQIQWSGANNPLWYHNNNAFKEIKADKQPIGKSDHRKPFTTHHIEYSPNSTFYLFTDGYPDQFGGPKGKKFMYKQLQKILLSSTNLLMDEQENILEKAFQDWKGRLEQIDDVSIIGVRV